MLIQPHTREVIANYKRGLTTTDEVAIALVEDAISYMDEQFRLLQERYEDDDEYEEHAELLRPDFHALCEASADIMMRINFAMTNPPPQFSVYMVI